MTVITESGQACGYTDLRDGELSMSTLLLVLAAVVSTIPILIAVKRKHGNIALLALVSFFLSWTIIGWVAAMAWAIWGRSNPKEFAKQSGEI